jgi:hypothetical protein|tara:strand:- start:10 stop:228 length:219 start_codon:yes stop_codon:yes gene_type:complete
MKESKLIEMQNKVDALTRVTQQLINEIQANTNIAQGTLTAFQLHIGEEKWKELVNEMKLLNKPKEKKFENVE